ncbi:MAG: NAD(P)-dependent oxidoreductase [Candidatus Omnitrophica bacterium]|nr:NAD(P)-dependent oxidoreductase [Candidatus Omnitrophota bacterium]
MVGNKKIDVMFYEAFEEEQKLLKELCPAQINSQFTSQTIQEKKDEEPQSTFISIRTQSKIPDNWAQNLEGILTRSTGYDHILDYVNWTETSAQTGYLPCYCARAVGEQALLLVMSLLRKLKKQINSFEIFNRDGLTGQECQNKNILVVGVGSIGLEIVDIAKGLRMNVAGVDIKKKVKDFKYISLASGLAWADIVVCALSLTKETTRMLGYEALKNVKKGAIFVNIARGEISPLKDLKQLLDEGVLAGVGLDVFEDEKNIAHFLRNSKKKPEDEIVKIIEEFQKRDDVVLTPHNAFNTKEALKRKAEQTMESVALFLKEKRFPCSVPLIERN